MTANRTAPAAGAQLEHPLGARGSFTLRLPAGSVSVRAVDGEVARVRDLTGRDLAERFDIRTSDHGLELSVRSRFNVTLQIGSLALGGGPPADLAVELPRATRVAIESASADASITGITGAGRYRTASGDLILQDVGGNVDFEAVSGEVRIDAVGPIELGGRTVSGDVSIRAPRLTRLEMSTTSGDVRLDAELAGKGPFAIRSISGDVTVVSRGALQVEGQTVTGDLMTELQHRTQSSPGRKLIIVGRGGETLAFRSVSGDLRVVEPRDAAPPETTIAIDPAATPQVAPPFAGTPPPVPSDEHPSPEAGRVVQPTTVAAAASPRADEARLEILRALERGDIDVETATARLVAVEEA